MDQDAKTRNYQYWLSLSDAMKLHDDEWCVICPFGIGDTYFVCAMAEEFLRYNGGRKFSVIVKPEHEEVAFLYNIISRIFVAEGINLEPIHQFSSFRPGNPIIGHPLYYEDGLVDLIGANGVTLLDLYYRIFRLPPKLPLKKPQVPEAYRQSAYAKFKTAGLPEGRTVILAPYANSSRTLPVFFWQTLAEALTKKGWTAVTNVTPQSPGAIAGTTPVTFSLGEALPYAEIAGRVISSRSGLCDLLSSMDERLTVLYLHQQWYAGTLLTGCGLNRMGLSQNVREIEISSTDSILDTIQVIVNFE